MIKRVTGGSPPAAELFDVKFWKNILTGALTSVFASVVLIFISAAVISAASSDPGAVTGHFAAVSASGGALAGGYTASRRNRARGLLSGLFTGAAACSLLFALMLATPASPGNAFWRLVIIICQLLFACAGGVAAVNRKPAGTGKSTYKRRT